MLDKIIKCPYCGESHYMFLYGINYPVYRPLIVKDGKIVNEVNNDNLSEDVYQCCNCGAIFNSKNAIKCDKDISIGLTNISITPKEYPKEKLEEDN